MEDPRIQEGLTIVQSLWYGIAVKIVNLAIEVYGLDLEQARALRDVYLRPGDYTVSLRN